ncbi:MAG: hypothetical protein K8F24_08090 [Bacteroidales bacterium]|nr:hypothetical protein [Bacteroidales bacterium]
MKSLFSILSIVLIGMTLAFSSCSSTPESKLLGTWKVTEVKVNFDEQKANSQTISQVEKREKQTILKFTSDSTLNIIDNNNTHRSLWTLDKDGLISYQFEKDQTVHELGVLEGNIITATSSTPLGDIITVFEKSK